MVQLPPLFKENMKALLKENYDAFLATYQEKSTRSFILNTKKINEQDFMKNNPFKIEKIPYSKNGYYLLEDIKIGDHPLHHAGAIYMQEPSAMIVENVISLKPNMKILDVCAAPGGKTIGLASKMENGILISNEVNHSRSKILVSNIERMGFSNVMVTNMDSEELSKLYKGYFDVVVVDAPCSGEGMFRKNPEAVLEWIADSVKVCHKRSLSILEKVSTCLKENGLLVYSTCTFEVEENEKVLYEFMQNHSYEMIDVPDKRKPTTQKGIALGNHTEKSVRFYPHIGRGEGQFVAVLQKKEPEVSMEIKQGLRPLSVNEQKIVDAFLENVSYPFPPIYGYKDRIVVVPEGVEVPSYKVVAPFVTVGTIQKGRLIPHHQFFKAYGTYFKNKVSLHIEDKETLAYLRGEELVKEIPSGFGTILLEGIPLGGFKASQGRLKNYYPKGLRIRK